MVLDGCVRGESRARERFEVRFHEFYLSLFDMVNDDGGNEDDDIIFSPANPFFTFIRFHTLKKKKLSHTHPFQILFSHFDLRAR